MSDVSHSQAGRIREKLLAFFDASARDLPWRGEEDPYRIWISEVMLQQTRVDTVIGYYRRWMERFPEVAALAEAEPEEVLQLWKGLGYYSRARNLRRAAVLVRERHGGSLPGTVAALRALPGVGEYTAGAVASIGFGVPTPAVDGNVRRVLSRLFDLESPSAAGLRDRAAALVDPGRPGDFNEALMELGATVCVPRSPRCGECPLSSECGARRAGTVAERPPPRRRSRPREIEVGVAVAADTRGGIVHVLLRRRPEGGLLAGLWEFPGAATAAGEKPEAAAKRALAECGVAAEGKPRALPEVRHAFSHLRATYRPCFFEVRKSGLAARPGEELRWVARGDLDSVPISRAQQRIAALMEAELESEVDATFVRTPGRDRSPGSPSSDPRGVPARSRRPRSG